MKEGSTHVVKVPTLMTSRLKKNVCDSFVGVGACPRVTSAKIGEWILKTMCVDVEVKRLNYHLFWIKPPSDGEFQCCFSPVTSLMDLLFSGLIDGRR